MDPETKFKVQNSGKNMINIDTEDESELNSDDAKNNHTEPEELNQEDNDFGNHDYVVE